VAAELKERFPNAEVRLVESSGGAFEVTVDRAPVFSKLKLGRHARDGEVVELVARHLARGR
jgi:selT/selW/selH-like putative selenoprotein